MFPLFLLFPLFPGENKRGCSEVAKKGRFILLLQENGGAFCCNK